MKAYKIFIPEFDMIDTEFAKKYFPNIVDQLNAPSVTVRRHGVNELVQKHAFELGYSWTYGRKDIKCFTSYLLFNWSGKIEVFENSHDFNKSTGLEISWQDFLKLTPADVMEPPQGTGVPDLPELTPSFQESKNNALTAEEINLFDVIGKPRQPEEIISDLKIMQSHHLKSIQKNYRNEKAWDILKVIIARPPYDGIPVMAIKNEDALAYVKNTVRDAFRYADEFIRQSNAGEKTEK